MKKALGVGFILARRTPCGVSARRGRRFRSDRSLDSGRQWTHTYRLKSLSDAVGQLSELCRTLSDAVGTLSDSVGPGLRAGLCRYRPSIPGVRVPRYASIRSAQVPREVRWSRCSPLRRTRDEQRIGVLFCCIRACLFFVLSSGYARSTARHLPLSIATTCDVGVTRFFGFT